MESKEHKIAWEGKYLRIRVCGNWEYAERCNSSAGIIIIAVTPEGKLLLTEQYRVPIRKTVLELPAGLAGDEQYRGEEFQAAAQRELREETGYEAAEWEQLVDGPTSAGLSNEKIVFFRGRNLRKVCAGGGAGEEKIQLHEVPLAGIDKWLRKKEREGIIVDPRIYTGLYFLLREGLGR